MPAASARPVRPTCGLDIPGLLDACGADAEVELGGRTLDSILHEVDEVGSCGVILRFPMSQGEDMTSLLNRLRDPMRAARIMITVTWPREIVSSMEGTYREDWTFRYMKN